MQITLLSVILDPADDTMVRAFFGFVEKGQPTVVYSYALPFTNATAEVLQAKAAFLQDRIEALERLTQQCQPQIVQAGFVPKLVQ